MMKRSSIVLISAVLSVLMLMTGSVVANERYGKQKVVYHVNYDDPKAQAESKVLQHARSLRVPCRLSPPPALAERRLGAPAHR